MKPMPKIISRLVLLSCFCLLEARATYAGSVTYTIPGIFRTTYAGTKTTQIPKYNLAFPLQSVTISFTPEISGTVSGIAQGPPNTFNGWAAEFSGGLTFSGIGFGTMSYSFSQTRSGLVTQPGIQVFQGFGPYQLTTSAVTFSSNLAAYTGAGSVTGSLAWPTFTGDLFWSRAGTEIITRDMGAVGGTVTYTYSDAPEPGSLPLLGLGSLGIFFIPRSGRRTWGSASRACHR